ncbi:ABC transporter ATP-binding protein [Paeniglutamicibacter antarcticus]|uniref:ABC transporter ATP-binding protein n=1 Tax=Arthrobacter terrae TaxID=2935737 RepID=A0A931CQ54_9MICC|nr:ABC transporter ATP-binding protein [Arthrobacter terrae]MBG0740091.1 ABC transporter ATP-binding protein [Arthrobacter terrae]
MPVLSASKLHVQGRHRDLLPATSLAPQRGTLLLVQGDGQDRRTALALTLTGRMRPTSGSVHWGHEEGIAHLRRHSALIDAPDVNEPEQHLSVQDLTAEDLALVPGKFRDRTRPAAWLAKHGHADIAAKWVDELAPEPRLKLLTDLALANADVDVLVVDSPDRHSADPQDWLPFLQRLAAGNGTSATSGTPDSSGTSDTAVPVRPLTVIVTVATIPGNFHGAVARLGDAPPGVTPAGSPGTEPAPNDESQETT